jgi:hypothetical protein
MHVVHGEDDQNFEIPEASVRAATLCRGQRRRSDPGLL